MRPSIQLPKRRATTRRGQGRDEVVLPTLELMRHKAAVLGGSVNAKGKPVGYDVHGSIWPLDVYLKRAVIEPRHHKAGLRYHRDRLAIYGMTTLGAASMWREVVPEHIGGNSSYTEELTLAERDDIEANRARRLYEATRLLQRCGVWLVVRLVVLDGILLDGHDGALRLGLEALAERWKIANDG